MFLREIVSKGKTYLYIVKTYWHEGKVKHKSIASLGRLDKLQNTEQLKKIAISLLSYCKDNKTHLDITTLEEKQRKIWGAPVVIRNIWDKFSLDEMFSKIIEKTKIKFDFFSSVFLMVMDRLCNPTSKLKTYEAQNKYFGIKENELHHLYRALDILSDRKDDIEKYLFDKNRNLFNTKVDVVFYDITTLYFESIKADALKEFGYSKDLKVNEVQIMLGLLVDQEGRPIGFDIFAGNTFEGNTISVIMEKLRKRFQIHRLVFIGDQAMLSKKNLKIIEDSGYEYIVGSRIRNKPEKIKEEILKEEGYKEVGIKEEGEVIKYKEIKTKNNRIICVFSSKREKKDRKERERLIEKALKLLENGKTVIKKRGALRYIKIESVNKKEIDEEKIEEDSRWDGYYAVETNCKIYEATEVISLYHQLWKIEEAFRILKSHLETRPIYHWTERRIKGHLVLCFVAFLIERALEMELSKNKIEYSPYKIREALNSLQFSEVKIEGYRFYIRSSVEGLANEILRSLRIKIPPQITTEEDFWHKMEMIKSK